MKIPPKNGDAPAKLSAETVFRAAFERLKRGEPEVLPKGTTLSQNNVAKEAGVDPSALRKSRFPSLIAEIQRYLADNSREVPPSPRQTTLAQRKSNRSLRERISEVQAQRDCLASLLNTANEKIIELTQRVAELKAKLPLSNVKHLDRRKSE